MLRIPFLHTITLSRRIFSKNCSPIKIARFLPLFFIDQNLELFLNNYQNRIIRRIGNNLFFHAESSLRKRTFILSWTETRLLHTYIRACVRLSITGDVCLPLLRRNSIESPLRSHGNLLWLDCAPAPLSKLSPLYYISDNVSQRLTSILYGIRTFIGNDPQQPPE